MRTELAVGRNASNESDGGAERHNEREPFCLLGS